MSINVNLCKSLVLEGRGLLKRCTTDLEIRREEVLPAAVSAAGSQWDHLTPHPFTSEADAALGLTLHCDYRVSLSLTCEKVPPLSLHVVGKSEAQRSNKKGNCVFPQKGKYNQDVLGF